MTTPNTAVQTAGRPQETVADFILSRRDALAQIAPKYLNVERLMRLALAAYSRNPELAKCSKASLLQFCIKCAETGTEKIGAGGAWPIAFWNNKLNPPQQDILFVSDYRNMIRVAKAAGVIKDATAEVVYENDKFHYTRGLHPELIHEPTLQVRGKLLFTYCVYELPDGRRDFRVLHEDDVNRRKRSSRAANNGPWKTHEPEMWRKTAVRAAMGAFEGSSKEMDTLMEADNDAEPIEVEPPIHMPKAIGETSPPADDGAGTDLGPAEPPPTPPPQPRARAKKAETTEPPPTPATRSEQPGPVPPAGKPETVQEELARFLGESEVSFDDTRSFMQTHSLLEDADSFADFSQLPTEACEKLKSNTRLMVLLLRTFGAKK